MLESIRTFNNLVIFISDLVYASCCKSYVLAVFQSMGTLVSDNSANNSDSSPSFNYCFPDMSRKINLRLESNRTTLLVQHCQLFNPSTSLFGLNKTEINNMLY